MLTRTEVIKNLIKSGNIDQAIRNAGTLPFSKYDELGQNIIMAREVLVNQKFYIDLFNSKYNLGRITHDGLTEVKRIYDLGVFSILNHKQFKL